MGRISKKLQTKFAAWASQYRQQMGKLKKSFPVPKDVHDVQSLVAEGYDPLHAVYIAVQNITSVFAECVSVLPELKSYYKTVGDAEEEYMPGGPPMSPSDPQLLYDLGVFRFPLWRRSRNHRHLPDSIWAANWALHAGMVEAVRQFQKSRMGIYEHCGTVGGKIGLEELVTGRSCPAICPLRLPRQARRTLVCAALPAAWKKWATMWP